MEFKLVKIEELRLNGTIDRLNNISNTNFDVRIGVVYAINELLTDVRIFAEKERCFVDLTPFLDIVKSKVNNKDVIDVIDTLSDGQTNGVPLIVSPFSNVRYPLGTVVDYSYDAIHPGYWLRVVNKYLESLNYKCFIILDGDTLKTFNVNLDKQEVQSSSIDAEYISNLLVDAVSVVVMPNQMPIHANSPVPIVLAFKMSVSMLIDEYLPSKFHCDEITKNMNILESQLKPFIELGQRTSNRPGYIYERPRGGEPTPVRFGPSNYGNSRSHQNINHGSPFWSPDSNYGSSLNKHDIKQYLEFLKTDVEMAMTMLDEETSEPEWDRLVNSLTHSCSSVANWFKQRGR